MDSISRPLDGGLKIWMDGKIYGWKVFGEGGKVDHILCLGEFDL